MNNNSFSQNSVKSRSSSYIIYAKNIVLVKKICNYLFRSWRSAVDIMMEKKPAWAPYGCTDNFHRRIRPKIILIYFDKPYRAKRKKCPVYRAWELKGMFVQLL